MCLRPRFIYVPYSYSSEVKKVAYRQLYSRLGVTGALDVAELTKPYFMNKVKVPCGTCVECLRSRQNDLAARVALYAENVGSDKPRSMHFLTLTYDEDYLPLSARAAYVNQFTGEVILDSVPKPLVRLGRNEVSPFSEVTTEIFREDFKRMKISSEPRVIELATGDPDVNGWFPYWFVTPSLHRRDVRMWLKSARVAYERLYGKPFSEFKYVMAGEFGPRTCRPHYHILFIGLSDLEMKFLENRWIYGFTKLLKVNQYNKDGSSGYLLAAKYISKYIIKGDFECKSVKDGFAQRPRVCISHFLGTTVPDDLVDYYRCSDLFGRYGLDSLMVQGSDVPFSLDQLKVLYTEVRKRAIIKIGMSTLCLPKCILKSLFSVPYEYYDIKREKSVIKARRSVVQMAFGSFVQSDLLDDYFRQFVGDSSCRTEAEVSSALSAFLASQEAVNQIKEEFGKKDFQSFYAKSIY